MQKDQILAQVNEVFKDVMENEGIVVNENTSANDIEEWDSLSHIYLIVEIEKRFDVKFSATEVQNFKNVGQMISAIDAKVQ